MRLRLARALLASMRRVGSGVRVERARSLRDGMGEGGSAHLTQSLSLLHQEGGGDNHLRARKASCQRLREGGLRGGKWWVRDAAASAHTALDGAGKGRGRQAHLLPAHRCARSVETTCAATTHSLRFRRRAQAQGTACEHASMRRAQRACTSQRRPCLLKPTPEPHPARAGSRGRGARSPGRAAQSPGRPADVILTSFRANENGRLHQQHQQQPHQDGAAIREKPYPKISGRIGGVI